jgi:hypothetical protein
MADRPRFDVAFAGSRLSFFSSLPVSASTWGSNSLKRHTITVCNHFLSNAFDKRLAKPNLPNSSNHKTLGSGPRDITDRLDSSIG